MIYTRVPPFFTTAQVFEMHARCVWRGLSWGCAV